MRGTISTKVFHQKQQAERNAIVAKMKNDSPWLLTESGLSSCQASHPPRDAEQS
ncbi:hypothetical protein [Xylella taiwanensis]|uniref:hypothetical protein n=1 Tax=Xylella taiwanensis TaxID=1444770 RepID=UPI0004BA1794|nr:hypothetical protein [Xylella taiwanensis]MCD8462832.1 hypothetical protein [Xylella taiwanensis]UFM93691.1 hypothetical protein LPH39_11590 [Xylella taiwanensis]UFN09038.1 hypothetical protein LPH45_11465 [Xylella taiwanensis]UFS51697.1 hypothetical protein LPH56_10755 [Xylella taiwanensis]